MSENINGAFLYRAKWITALGTESDQ